MRYVSIIAWGIAFYALGVTAVAQESHVDDQNSRVTISARGKAVGQPDTMVITLAAEATAGNASDALRQCKDKADAATKGIADLNIKDAEISRDMYVFSRSASGDPFSFPPSSAAPVGTTVSQVITVKVPLRRPLNNEELSAEISAILDAATKVGVGLGQPSSPEAEMFGERKVEPVKYVLEDDSTLKAQALKDAIAQVDEIRKRLAESGVKTGDLVRVDHHQFDGPAEWGPFADHNGTQLSPSPTSSSPEKIFIHAQLTCVYDLVAE